MFNLAGFGALGFGFTMNLGGNREGGPQFRMGFSFLPLLIGAFVIITTSLGELVPAIYGESSTSSFSGTGHTQRGSQRSTFSGGSRSRTNPHRVRATPQYQESGFFEYLFYSIYIVAIITFIGYAFFQRNRHNTGRP
jgi:hypothetical protein